jgi:uncharacterized membrane protein YsdA (DUF1294 family)
MPESWGGLPDSPLSGGISPFYSQGMMLSPQNLLSHIGPEDALAWIVIANIVAYVLFYADKKASQTHSRRISEKMLLLWCAVGGSLGGYLAMRRFRHKTQKQTFRYRFFIIVGIQALVAVRVLVWPL